MVEMNKKWPLYPIEGSIQSYARFMTVLCKMFNKQQAEEFLAAGMIFDNIKGITYDCTEID